MQEKDVRSQWPAASCQDCGESRSADLDTGFAAHDAGKSSAGVVPRPQEYM